MVIIMKIYYVIRDVIWLASQKLLADLINLDTKQKLGTFTFWPVVADRSTPSLYALFTLNVMSLAVT